MKTEQTNPKDTIHPTSEEFPAFHGGKELRITGGLTKREYFAGLAMQGLLASIGSEEYAPRIAKMAVLRADALITALNEEPSKATEDQ